jgi:putative addiction module component (TIGR02574 family)
MMTNYDSVLAAAQQLPAADQIRLLDALWESVPEDAVLALSPEWEAEIARRVARIKAGEPTSSWEEVREAAFLRLPRG